VLDVNASDLPAKVKTSLKALAHDLAGALVFDYGKHFCCLYFFLWFYIRCSHVLASFATVSTEFIINMFSFV